MMERFNFFDLYGYLIPGSVWLALMGLPFVLSAGAPSWTVAAVTVAGVLGGYVAGHLLYGMARVLFSSVRVDERHLSEQVLDADGGLSAAFRERLVARVKERFEIDIMRPDQRKEAFFLCRTALAQAKLASYVEQYQGMNALTRGTATACLFTWFFYAGWLAALPLWDACFSLPIALALLLAPIALIVLGDSLARRTSPLAVLTFHGMRRKSEGIVFALILAALGFAASGGYHLESPQGYRLAIAGGLLLVACRRLAIAATSFDESLAKAVYRDFLVLATTPKDKADHAGGG